MLSNPTTPLAAPSAERPAAVRAQGHQAVIPVAYVRAFRINWRWVGMLAITLACLINGITVSRWLYAQEVTLAASVIVGGLVFLVSRFTIWISAKI
jgi:hypothetical protein